MKFMGIDYGTKRIGIAVSNEEGTIAFPRATIANDAHTLESLMNLIEEAKIQAIVIGDTRSFSHLQNPVTKEAESFIARLKKKTNLPVESVFEAGSSIEASRYAPENTGHSDEAAAAVILQRCIDTRNNQQPRI